MSVMLLDGKFSRKNNQLIVTYLGKPLSNMLRPILAIVLTIIIGDRNLINAEYVILIMILSRIWSRAKMKLILFWKN